MIRRITTVLFLTLLAQSTGCADRQATSNVCKTSGDCPPSDNPCLEAFCDYGTCSTTPVEEGTLLPEQVSGDCKTSKCDANGKLVAVKDNTDVPVDDNACTEDLCVAGAPSNPPVAAGSACSENGGAVCNPLGVCVECLAASDCPGQDTDCQARACEGEMCGVTYAAAGTSVGSQTPGDCKAIVCDGAGGTTIAADNMDLPNDGNSCTADVCASGVPQNPNLPLGTACNQNGGKVCDINGKCVQCNVGSQCASGVCASGICQAPTCTDNVKNGSEVDIDCGGGACLPCVVGDGCALPSDCITGICQSSSCQPAAVISTSPAGGATAVSVTTDLSVIFSGPMNPTSLVGQTVSGPCTGSVQLSTDNFLTCLGFASASPMMSSDGTTATFTPSPALSYGSTYSIRVTTAAQSTDGSALGATYKSATGFTTETPPGTSCGGSVVISQVFGGGGNSGAPYKSDFVELHNRGKTTVNLAGWSVQYASAAGSTWIATNLSGSIVPGGYYLVQGAAGTSGAALPTPDASGMTNMSAAAGKVALVKVTTALSGACPTGPNIVDLIGYGTTTTCFEGSAPAPAGSNTASLSRGDLGCADMNDSKADFTSGAVTPRNSATAPYLCVCGATGTANESGVPAEIDLCNVEAPPSISVAVSSQTPAIYGRVFESGVTEAAGANPLVIAQVGYGPASINPSTQSGWTFFPTTYNVQAGNADEYMGTLTAPAAAGSYRYAVRASLDGVAWTYCDLNGAGSSPGATFEITQLPILTVTP